MNIGPFEWLIVLLVLLLLFGIGWLTRLASSIGRAIKEFNRSRRSDSDSPADSDRKGGA